ncbi:MAG: sensor histidine kinase [Lachnospiraceae bacterium]|nr:sensor histidine kinase [Lachnospiraceae bacterium]
MHSFRRELVISLVAVALIPLIISSFFLVSLFENRLSAEYQQQSAQEVVQIEETLTSFFDGIYAAADTIRLNSVVQSDLAMDDSWIRSQIYATLYKATADYRGKADFQICSPEGEVLFTTASDQEDISYPVYWDILKVATAHPDTLIIRRASEFAASGVVLQAARALINNEDECLGYLVANLTASHLSEVLSGAYTNGAAIVLMDQFWEEIYHSSSHTVEGLGETLRTMRMKGDAISRKVGSTQIYIRELPDLHLTVVLGRSELFTSSIRGTLYRMILLLAVINLLICLFAANVLSRYLSAPITRMINAMRRVRKGDLNTKIEVDRKDELGQLSESFNRMTGELKSNLELQVTQQQELNDANFAMMQAQLNPHFLYNTLDTMKWVAKLNNIPEVATMSSDLARILRTSISEGKFITLSQEIELVESYVEIQRIRFSEGFSFDVEVPMELEDCIVPKLILQPIVENAIIHGMKDKENGHIFLNAYEESGILKVEISDDGSGMEPEMMALLNGREHDRLRGHIGFYNVDTILRSHYGEQYGLQAEALPEGGTKVTVSMPVVVENDSESKL